ncbi:fumarylacetoacetate hydrolase family protein [Candidatus Sumerlaeota bacterium]|nr:fumarylacetoacetate hydrolase family protein [Candidatus Sumerlaeota bacterium]
MRLIRFGEKFDERPGVLNEQNERLDCSPYFEDWNSAFWANDGMRQLEQLLSENEQELPRVAADARWAAPIARPGKVVCIGKNYQAHANELGEDPPAEPLIFMKAPNATIGPYDTILIPRQSLKTDWEVELGVVIGAEARYLSSPAESRACVAGYLIANDVSEREFQKDHCGQWTKGKSCDTFLPLGPWLLLADALADPQNLELTLDVNGERRQTGNTSDMIFGVDFLIHYLSQFMTLEPGDLICTGTPPGVGLGMDPPQFLQPGDEVRLTVAGLGEQRCQCLQA